MPDPFPPPDLGDLRSLALTVPEPLEFNVPICLTCLGYGVITVCAGGPDSFGNYDSDEIRCPECDGSGEPAADPETGDLSDGGGRR